MRKMFILILFIALPNFVFGQVISKKKLMALVEDCKGYNDSACDKLKAHCMKQSDACGFAAAALAYRDDNSSAIFYAKKGCNQNNLFSCEIQNTIENGVAQQRKEFREQQEPVKREAASSNIDWSPTVQLIKQWDNEPPKKKKIKCVQHENGYNNFETTCEEK